MQKKIMPIITRKARDLVDSHRDDARVVITATNRFVTAPIAREFGIENLIATEPEERAGEFTGRVKGVPSFREGKVERLRTWMREHGIQWDRVEETWFYSDSLNDLPLLSLVSHPVAVDPDETLKEHALMHDWRVISLR
jgi:HAD superfamily hydrolase (TIGR01490 family)